MEQHAYVDEHGEVIEPKDNKKKIIFIVGVVVVILVLVLIIMFTMNNSKKKKCNNIENMFKEAALDYARENDLLPSLVDESVTIDATLLIDNGFLTDKFSVDDNSCGGSAKITRVNNEYVVTVDVTSCGICTTSERYNSWSDWTTKEPNKQIVDVEITYNYVKKTINYTDWTDYYTPAKLEKNPITDYTDSRFADISEDAKNIEIIKEDANYYRYRDKKWKFYRNINNNYSNFSSIQPSGYSKKDTSTARKTEWSDWTVNYPGEEDYRKIEERIGYRWYYKDGKEKVYYNGGQYLPESPDDTYTLKDNDDKATIWRYQDTEWRWYNGEERGYSFFMSEATSTYKYKDEGLTSYGSYSSWADSSRITDENREYREEEIEVRTRYRLKYDLFSYELLNEPLSKIEFEKSVGSTIEDIENSEQYALITVYRYRYRK